MSPTPTAAPTPRPMTRMDLSWLRMDQPTNRMIITGLLLFTEPLRVARLKTEIQARLLLVERFHERIRRRSGRIFWERDPDFDLDFHVRKIALPPPGDEAALQQLVGALMAEPLAEDRPLWSLYLVEDYGAGSALIVRLHHCIGDGIALMMLLLSLTDLSPEPDAQAPNPLAVLFHRRGQLTDEALARCHRFLPEGMKVMVRPSGGVVGRTSKTRLVASALAALTRLTFSAGDPPTRFKGQLGVKKQAAWSQSIPLGHVRELKNALGTTINDVLLAATAGGLRRYLEAKGDRVHQQLNVRAAVPVSLRRVEQLADLGNQFGLVFLPLPVGLAEPHARLSELKQRMERLKGAFEAGAIYAVLHVMGIVPHLVHRLIVKIFGTKATTVMTNVPGPREPLWFAGSPISDLLFWVPRSGQVSMGISIISYADKVRFGVVTDAGLVPDPELIIAGFERELAAMQEHAGLR